MSYHLSPRPLLRQPARRRVRPTQQPPPLYPLVPLSAAAPPTRSLPPWLVGLVVVIALILLLMWMQGDEDKEAKTSQRIKKMSTAEMAHNLHQRLEKRGRASETTMRALARYASER